MSTPDLRDVRLHVVTGKGGTGKTTVAAALALALARDGRKVLLCEAEGRQGIARLFDLDPLPYAERRIARGWAPEGGQAGQVFGLHIDPEAALLEYLQMYYHLGRAGTALDKFGVVEFATTIAPGVRDVLLTGKVYEAAKTDRRGGGQVYDAVVLDAPPTGRIGPFLGVSGELSGLAKVGPIRTQADAVMGLFTSDQTVVHFVTLLEEMPVQETVEGIAELRAAGLPVGAVILNQVRPRVLDDEPLARIASGDFSAEELLDQLKATGLQPDLPLLESLLAEGRDHAVRRALEAEQRQVLDDSVGRPGDANVGLARAELPLVTGGVDHSVLLDLAGLLADQLLGDEPTVDGGDLR